MTARCAVCRELLSADERARLAADTDFVEHGEPSHLIRVARVDRDTQSRFRFFLKHAGYATPPGRAACALELARVERLYEQAEDLGIASLILEPDDFPYDPGDVCTEEQAAAKFESGEWTGPYSARLNVGEEEGYVTLAGIVFDSRDTSDPYCRVIRAELASAAEDELRQAIGDAEDARRADASARLQAVQSGSWGDWR